MIWKPWARPSVPVPAAPRAVSVTQPPAQASQPGSTAPVPPAAEKKEAAEAAPRNPGADVAPAPQPKQLKPETDHSLAPQTAVQAYHRGRDLLRGRDFLAAMQSFTKAISLRPDYAEAYYYRGLVHQRLEENVAAVKDYSEAIRLRPQDAFSYRDRGICRARLHQDDQALADFERTLKLRPDSPDASPALNGRGEIFMRRRQYNSALHDLNVAISLSPEYEVAYRNRGQVRHALGNESGAAADFRKANELRAVAASSRSEK
jgi:tetratricopeptide (TPR) repeat protein